MVVPSFFSPSFRHRNLFITFRQKINGGTVVNACLPHPTVITLKFHRKLSKVFSIMAGDTVGKVSKLRSIIHVLL